MDSRILAALMTLAAAAGASPALAEELQRYAQQRQEPQRPEQQRPSPQDIRPEHRGGAADPRATVQISRGSILRSTYNVALSPNGASVGAKAFAQLGYNSSEAAQMTEVARGIARKAGSYENFEAVIDGRSPKGGTLTARETALLRSLAARSGGAAYRLHQGLDGHTWEGHGGNTWEGSSNN